MNPRDIVVFLGPSLPIEDARRILPARYLGPARCGDVLRARRLRPRAIAIVDGVFGSTPSVWHKEILLALEDGIAVFGASSMGALRAAELANFGMIGIGRIFEAYRDGLCMDDDEVALLHGPAESAHREMSEAMVNIRATVAQAVSARVICPDAAERVIRSAKNTFYQERSIAAAIDAAWAHDRGAEERKKLLRYIANGGYVNQKRLDAVTLLEHLAGRGIPRAAVASSVHRTSFITKLHFDTVCAPFDVHAADLPKDELVALEARALGRFYPLLCRLARLMAAVHALDLDGDSRARSRLARIRATVDAHEHKHGTRAVARARARHMVNLMRLDDGYRRLRDARGGNREVELYRKSAALWAVIHDHLEQNRVGLPGTLQTLSDDFRRRRGLGRRDATFAWRRANDLDGRGYDRIVAMEARLAMVTSGAQAHALGLRPATDPACWLIDAIRWSGLYSRLEKRIAGTTARNPDLPVASVCKNSAPPGSRKSRRRSS